MRLSLNNIAFQIDAQVTLYEVRACEVAKPAFKSDCFIPFVPSLSWQIVVLHSDRRETLKSHPNGLLLCVSAYAIYIHTQVCWTEPLPLPAEQQPDGGGDTGGGGAGAISSEPQQQQLQHSVWRRYSDFEALATELAQVRNETAGLKTRSFHMVRKQ